MEIEFGSNLTFLGLLFLGFKYLLPVLIGAALLFFAYKKFLDYPNAQLDTTDRTTILGILGLIIVIILLTI